MLRRLLMRGLTVRWGACSSTARQPTPVASEEDMHTIFRKIYSNKEKRIYSFYCSDYDRIVVD